ncbi:MAG TPA: PAS domain-containing protein, partial [Acetobacteraceae bacterium]|nr:PAS domain-containing protein [Acetobacteraceae bacterium]
MGALIRAFDWAATPLGPASAWPQALRTTLRLMLNTRHPMFLWWGPELIQFYNDALKDIIGSPYHPHALGRGGRDFLPQVWDGIIPGIEQVLAGRGATWQENQHIPIMRNGRIDDAWWTYGYTPVDDEGQIGGVLGICTETTRQVLTEQRLRAAEERNQLALEAEGVVGTWMWDVPADRVYAGARFAHVYEVDPARAEAGAPVAEFVAAIHPEDRERVAEAIGQATAAGGNFDQEYRLVRSDGSVLWVSARGHCRLDEEGRPLRFSGILVDVTERRLAEDALRASEAKFQAIADSIDHMIWATRPDGYHDYYNQRWYDFTGAAIGSTFGEAWNGLLHPDDEEQARSIWRHSLRTGNPFRAEFRLRTRSGAFRWVLARAHAARDRQGRITRWFGTCTEIQEIIEAREVLAHSRHELARLVADRTAELRAANDRLMKEAAERERAEDALRQSQKMEAVGQLTGGIAHDFNNLLAGIAGSLELIQTRIAQGRTENLERYLSAAMGSAQRASALTHRLLAFSRRQTLDPRPTRVERLIAGMEELIRRSAGPQISLETVAAPDLWTVLCDPNQLESALLNLAINARDAMPDGGLLTVEAANAWLDEAYAARQADLAPGAYVVISITDTGAGMSADVIGRAFEPFFTTKPIGQGTGLGL